MSDVRETLVDDGTGEIFFWIPEGSQVVPHFLMGVQDGGGYSSVFMSKDCWEKMKKKVEALIEQHLIKADPEIPRNKSEFHPHEGVEEDLT